MKHIHSFKIFEGKAFKSTKKPVDDKPWDDDRREVFRNKIKSHIKGLGATVDPIGNDFELWKSEGGKGSEKKVAQIMFRKDKISIKKEGGKFSDDFDYKELGNIKKKLTEILKD
jgi:hypothetical protein